ncbi:hypothetical protein Tco_1219831 [Tanacetum coccineum]
MLEPRDEGFILYQAYGNLYAKTGRKAHLLEDKQIPSVGVFDEVYLAFGRHLEEIHMTWAHLEKKRTRLRTNTKTLEDLCSQSLKTASPVLHDAVTTHLVTASQPFMTASARTDSYTDLEDSTHDGNANPPPTSNHPVLPAVLRAQAIQELHELQRISAFVDSRLESIERFLNNFANQPNETNMNDLESDDESVDTPLVSPFPHSEMIWMTVKKYVTYFDPFLAMNIITRKAYNTIMVEGLESTGKNLVVVVRDVYVFVGSFTYITDFVVLEDIGEFIQINQAEVVMGKPFRKITKLEYDFAKGLMSFNRIFDSYTF